jgi:saccharopine dehydrogenase (NADP+, L-glutamate forming)
MAFRSYTGGLIAPESDNNPWHYKFTWNPRNVVLAGQGTARYIINGQYKYIPYHRLFSHTEPVVIDGYGNFEGYPNRDSLSYRPLYGLQHIPTIIRGTLRREGFCRQWNTFVQLGMTDDSYVIENSATMSYREFTNLFLQYSRTYLVEEKVAHVMGVSPENELIANLKWLGLFGHERIGLEAATPAQILQKILEEKWALAEDDKDMIVMQHLIDYVDESESKKRLLSSLVVKGRSQHETAMAITVGLPLAIAARLYLEGTLNASGVKIPVEQAVYEPILNELAQTDIVFSEKIELIDE